jgi:iron complex outermembrane recepter protein
MRRFTLNPLVLAIAVASLAPVVHSQDGTVEEVVVTGSFRDSLKNAINLKRNTTASVDSIVAEDIGEFPDNNLAESMQRIPGVNIDRAGGEGKQISVRGLSADFTRVRINGMETIATGIGNRTRAFDFNIFASELFSRIDVRKSQSAEIDEGSLGATVDLYTGRPLDFDEGLTFVTSYQQGFNDQSESFDPRGTALVSFKNSDSTLGALFSVAYSERNIDQQGHNSGRWDSNFVPNPAIPANTETNAAGRWANAAAFVGLEENPNTANHPRFPRQLDRNHDLDRLGLTGSLQWQPSDNTTLTLDAMFADIGSTVTDLTLTPISLSRATTTGKRQTTVGAHHIDTSRNIMDYAELTGVDVRAENFQQDWGTTFSQYSLAFEHSFTDSLRIDALVGTSESELEVTKESTIIFEKFNQSMTYDYRDNEKDPTISYGFDLANPASWQLSEVRDRPADTTNTNDTARLNVEFDLSDVFTLKGGFSWKEFSFDNNQFQLDRPLLVESATVGTPPALGALPAGCDLTLADLAVTADMGSVYTPGNGQNTFFLPNLNAVADKIGLYDSACFPLTRPAGSDRSVTETDTGGHLQLDFNTELAGLPFRGDVGVRQVETKQVSSGTIVGVVDPVTVERKYTDTLPAINLALEVVADVLVRASWAEVMTRPSLGSLTPGGTVNKFANPPLINSGNPNLDPFRADATDLTLEWYFAEESMLSLAWFNKKIDSFPQSTTLRGVEWGTLGLPDSVVVGGTYPTSVAPNSPVDLTALQNGGEGELDGWEVQYQQPLDFLPGPAWVKNFGIKANFTSIDSEIDRGASTGPLEGQSDTSWNGTLWYENESGFSGRVSATYRSEYVTTINSAVYSGVLDSTGKPVNPGYDNNDEVTTIDAAFSYQVNDNVKISLDMLNLTDEPETTLLSDYNLIDTTLTSGRQYYLGVQYSF